MALSFEESKKQLVKQVATPAVMSMANPGIMTLEDGGGEAITAYSVMTKNPRYPYFEKYVDENISTIDDKKEITVHSAQVNISQEANSQFIPFVMKRYYDGIDINDMALSIHYTRSDGTHGASTPVNVEFDEADIRFVWLVDEQATCVAGALNFEIHADGSIFDTNGNEYGYRWKSKPTDKFNIVASLCNTEGCEPIVVTDDWVVDIVENVADAVATKIADAQVGTQVTAAENAAIRAETAATSAESAATTAVETALADYSTTAQMQEYVTTEIANADIDNKLTAYAKTDDVEELVGELGSNEDGSDKTVKQYVDDAVNAVDVSEQLKDYALKSEIPTKVSELENDKNYLTEHQSLDDYALKTDIPTNVSTLTNDAGYLTEHQSLEDYATKTHVQEEIAKVDVSDQLVDYAKSADVNTAIAEVQAQVNTNKNDIATLSGKVSTNETNIGNLTTNATALSSKITELEAAVKEMGDQAGYEYYATYGTTTLAATGEETENVFTLYEVDGDTESVKSQFVITGGSGGGSASATTLTVTRVTSSPLTITTSDKAIIEFNCTSYDADGETVDCSYTWKKGGSVIMSGSLVQGLNTFDLTEYVTTGTHKFTLTVADEGGSMSVKTWTVQMVDVRIESTFNDKVTYNAGETVSFTYTPYGAISKVVHFKLDGVELDPVTTTVSGLLQSYTLPAQAHGAHLLEVWMTATVNSVEVETPHIYKDIIWYDTESEIPVIGCIYRYDHYGLVEARQYNATDITYVVYDPAAENPTVTRYVDGESIGEQILDAASDTWSYKSSEVGEKVLVIECGVTTVEIRLDVAELGIDIEPVTANMAFDFNPTGRSNNDADRIWSDANTGVTMTVSNNFDWTNGGYQRDDNGDTYFCVKAGTTATINYNLFGSDYDPKLLGKEFKFVFKTTNVKKRNSTFLSCINGTTPIGIDMKVESANIYASNKELYIPYCEEDIIEFEFNINKDTDIPMVMTYEDGVANRPLIYASDSSFMQLAAKPITIGSEDCDVHVYRMKAYNTSLTDKEILTNFIADARNADEMIARYERNQIYDENNALTPETLAEKCPDLRIIMIDAPWFTNDKDDKVKNTTIRQIYKGGDAVLDNWTCTGAQHSGQGTSSNKYGYAGRNIRLIMNKDESLFTFNGTNEDGTPITGKTFTFTRDSVPTDFVNIKVNIASSENQNNAQFAQRYNEFNPVIRPAKVDDQRVRDTMEFHNCVVFIRENDPDLTKHREFNDTNYHYYALGNMGDDKKTDFRRANDATDPKEFILEIADFDVPLGEFPTGKENGTGGAYISPEEFVAGNTAYDNLYSEYTYDEEGKFKAFGAESYEFRYEMDGITDEQRQTNIDVWREFYKFVVTSTDEEFVENLGNYFVVDSALYYYLFTERYLMTDNRCKNSFWHYGKCDDGIYRFDLCFAYDMDTAIGIDNTGKLVLTYGLEDVDKDASGAYVYRAAESNFFCRIRDLFADRLKGMFQSRESLGAWSATSLINQWDEAQNQFPEELWRLDIIRKYIRTYKGESVDNSIVPKDDSGNPLADPMFLEPMLNGRKRYQRRQFERNNELYFATKYISTTAKNNFIRLRFNNPIDAVVKQDYTIYLTPYSDMYLGVAYGNTDPVHFRAKAGVEYTIERDTETATADIIEIYGASFIQAIGDLSKCYLGDNSFAMATRLQSLTIGSDVEGYENTFMNKLSLGNNKLLEYLDIRNVTGFVKATGQKDPVIDLSGCSNLLELRAEGAGITGVIFANGGKIEKAYLPAITSLTMKNLNNIEEFKIENYDGLQTLIVENVPAINTYNIVNSSPSLNTVRLVGIDWNSDYGIKNTDILDRLYDMRGVDANGYGTTVPEGSDFGGSVVTGAFYAATVKEREKVDYKNAWPYLDITEGTLINQFVVTFKNEDGTVLDVQYVDKGGYAVDPTTRAENQIAIPTKESTISTNYTFNGWDIDFETLQIFKDYTITATYAETTREYTVTYESIGYPSALYSATAPYGSTVAYGGDVTTPVYTDEEGGFKFYLFTGWDRSGYVDGDKTIKAMFDTCEFVNGYFDDLLDGSRELSDLRPVELYMMTKLGLAENYIVGGDEISITFGNDVDYSDIDAQEIISEPRTFTGASGDYYNTGLSLFSGDKSFVLAIEYNVTAGDTIAQCFSDDTLGDGQRGFRIRKSGASVAFNVNDGSANTIANANSREIVVIRHIKGENNLHVYSSSTASDSIVYTNFTATSALTHDRPLVFGCYLNNGDVASLYSAGTVYWAKLWNVDLGDSICRDLAAWPHETMPFKACYNAEDEFGNQTAKTYTLSDGSYKNSSMTFIASNVLPIAKQFDASSTTGGYAASDIKVYLDDRIYAAMPIQWKQLLKEVIVSSTAGNKSTSIVGANCHIFIPSVAEVYPGRMEPYTSEGTMIAHMTNTDERICTDFNGIAVEYWTRSPNASYENYIYTIEASGSMDAYNLPSNTAYIRIMFTI